MNRHYRFLFWLVATMILLCSCQESSEKTTRQVDKPAVVRKKIPDEKNAGLNPLTILAGKALPSGNATSSADPAAELLASNEIIGVYRYQGKLDPFLPLIKEEKAKPSAGAAEKLGKKKRAPQTPLERIDLSQLTLTAIFRKHEQSKALVEEPTGKGYMVKEGTYIGLDGGQITKILKDRILISEESEDVMGKPVTIERELKLRQFSGE